MQYPTNLIWWDKNIYLLANVTFDPAIIRKNASLPLPTMLSIVP